MKIAVVTGASRGIGHFLSEKLSKENYRVVNISEKVIMFLSIIHLI